MKKGQVTYLNGHMPPVQRACERHGNRSHEHQPAFASPVTSAASSRLWGGVDARQEVGEDLPV